MTLDEVLQRFENPRKTGNGFTVRCPSHNDKQNSLSIGAGREGKIVIKCFAGCETTAILGAVGLKLGDLFPPNGAAAAVDDPVIARYVYTDEGGNPLFRVCRRASKSFFQERFENGAYVPGLKGARRVPYNLPAVMKSKSVVIVEGEKDVETLRAIGVTATTNAGGANAWRDDYAPFFKDKRIFIIPDNDDPGRRHGRVIAQSVMPVAEMVKIVELPDVPDKGDVSDYLGNHSKEDLFTLLKAAKAITAESLKELVSAVEVKETPAEAGAIEEILISTGVANLTRESTMDAVEEVLRNLQSLLSSADEVRRTVVREAVIRRLGQIDISAPAKMLDAALGPCKTTIDDQQGKPLILREIVPHDDEVNGSELLVDVCRAIRRYIVADNSDIVAMALWCVHAHAIDAFAISPFLNITSPTKGCGKSTALTVMSYMLPRPLLSGNISPASIYRTIEKFKPTFLIDEADSFENLNEDFRGLLNASHLRASAQVIRVAGDEHEPRMFSTWCPKVISLIGRLPDTLEDRSIVIDMRRRKRDEVCERFSAIDLHPDLELLGQKMARWVSDHSGAIKASRPVAEGIDLRVYDNWMPLLAVADIAGGSWPEWARIAVRRFVAKTADSAVPIKVELLIDMAKVMEGSDRMSSEAVVAALNEMDDRPWPTFNRGKPITQIRVSGMLRGFGIKPTSIRIGDKTPKGYHTAEVVAALSRYVSPPDPQQPQQEKNEREIEGLQAIFVADQPATENDSIVPDPQHSDPQPPDADGFEVVDG